MSNSKELFTNLDNNRRFYWRGTRRVYVCRVTTCTNKSVCREVCITHKDEPLEPEPEITEIIINKDIFEYILRGGRRFRHKKDTEKWIPVCEYKGKCPTVVYKSRRCKKHRDGTKYPPTRYCDGSGADPDAPEEKSDLEPSFSEGEGETSRDKIIDFQDELTEDDQDKVFLEIIKETGTFLYKWKNHRRHRKKVGNSHWAALCDYKGKCGNFSLPGRRCKKHEDKEKYPETELCDREPDKDSNELEENIEPILKDEASKEVSSIIVEVDEGEKVIEYMLKEGKRYKRTKGTKQWLSLCNYKDKCITSTKGDNFCKKHSPKEGEFCDEEKSVKKIRYKLSIENFEQRVREETTKRLANKMRRVKKKEKEVEEKIARKVKRDTKRIKAKGEIFTDPDSERRYRNKGDGRIFLCMETSCMNDHEKNGFCNRHQNLYIAPEIIEVEEHGNIVEYIIMLGKRYKRTKGNKTWCLTCNFNNKTCPNIRQNGEVYCNKHKGGVENERLNKNPILDTRKIVHENQEFRTKCKEVNKIGDETEEYCREDIAKIKDIESAIRTANGDRYTDIIYKYKGKSMLYSVQVKTLSKDKRYKDVYQLHECNKYGEGLLIVGYNKERTRFLLVMSDDIPKSGSVTLSYNHEECKYKEYMFTDKAMFLEHLEEYLKHSREYVECLTKLQLQEKDGLNRIKEQCEENKLSFALPRESACIYDCMINGWKVQCKTTNSRSLNLYKLHIYKHGGMVGGKYTRIPYDSSDDIDFVLIEILDESNNFYIIPKEKLIEKDIFSNESVGGSTSIYVPPEGYKGRAKHAWLLDYRNEWSEISK